ncbi:MAG: hypothetical protein C3F13_16430 [Anaerolineales bacterium]|nr:MAG: hypothetical protein C3F13_16430 [Anaerolineales bacterium]
MNEITISKKKLFTFFLAIILLAAVAFGIYTLWRLLPSRQAAQQPVAAASLSTPDADLPAQAAAVAGAQAFYSVDYQMGKQAWLDQLCAVSTNIGCTMDQNVFVPALWPQLESGKTSTSVKVSAQEKVLDQVNPLVDVPQQVWKLAIQLSEPWPAQETPLTSFPALALVVRENGVWKFERFLTEDEANALENKAGQP